LGGLYIVTIILPMILLITLLFIFSSSLDSIALQQLRTQCPFPIYQGVATPYDISDNNQVLYTVDNRAVTNYQFSSTPNFNGTNFICYDANAGISAISAPAVTTQIKNYGYNFSGLNFGWFVFASDTLTSVGDKIQANLALVWLYFNAPAEVTGLAWFTYLNFILSGFIGLGIFFAIRGIGN